MPSRRRSPDRPPQPIPSPGAGADAPLAARMRPRSLDEFVGQTHLVGPEGALSRVIRPGYLPSMILWGPPGSGKTTLARLLAERAGGTWRQLSAVTSGVADVRAFVAEAKERREAGGQTVLFIDELHRFNKAQQDALLPHVEDGTVTLIGATTENPYYEINAPLLSRARVYRLSPLAEDDLRRVVERALADDPALRGSARLSDEGMATLLDLASGDARQALNILEAAAAVAGHPDPLTPEAIAEAAQQRLLAYDRLGDQHYEAASAFIKSMRGNDPDAALYWCASMIAAGEDPTFVARRIVIAASEDVGNADPRALAVAVAAMHAVEMIGLPECQYALAQAAAYVASAPKSNRVGAGYFAALADVTERGRLPVPIHLRQAAHPRLRREYGYGAGYLYPHDFPGGDVDQQYLPDQLAGRVYYEPSESGLEATIGERLERLRRERRAAQEGHAAEPPSPATKLRRSEDQRR
jgi:putative ATPase